MISKFKKGFSLIELLVVIAIIGILAAVGITAYSGYTAGAKEKSSFAQHSQVVALLNSELARCAAGEGTYVWGDPEVVEVISDDPEVAMVAAAFAPDSCFGVPDQENIVAHINGTGAGQLGMTNPYDATVAFAVDGVLGVTVATLGESSIHCGALGSGCQVTTLIADGDMQVSNIQSY